MSMEADGPAQVRAAKRALRAQVISQRDAIPAQVRAAASEEVCARVLALPALARLTGGAGGLVDGAGGADGRHADGRADVRRGPQPVVAVFCPFGSEVLLAPLVRALMTADVQLAAPVSLGGRHMEFVAVRPRDLLDRDATPDFLAHPARTAKEGMPAGYVPLAPSAISFMVMPGVAFDLEGGRLGYGGGYYDTYLSRQGFAAPTCAVCFDEQVLPAGRLVPAGPCDLKPDLIATPTRLISSRRM